MNLPSSSAPKAPRRIGIAWDADSVFLPEEVGWSHQSAYFLAQCLAVTPQVEAVYWVVPDATDPAALQRMWGPKIKVMPLAQACTSLNLLLDPSPWVPDDWVSAFRSQGGQLVQLVLENPQVKGVEGLLFDRPPLLSAKRVVDAVWIPAAHLSMSAMSLSAWARAPVFGLPRLWAPVFVQRQQKRLPKGVQYGYRPGRSKWRLAVCESNQSMVSACHIPMLAAEVAYRQDPRGFEKLWVMDAYHLKTNAAFVNFATSLQWVRDGNASFEAHHAPVTLLSQHAEAILAHHWEGSAQGSVLEALYGGYPVVHNDAELQSWGYAYQGFDCEAAGAALLHAKQTHDQNFPHYRAQVLQLLSRLDPKSASNVQAIALVLDALGSLNT